MKEFKIIVTPIGTLEMYYSDFKFHTVYVFELEAKKKKIRIFKRYSEFYTLS